MALNINKSLMQAVTSLIICCIASCKKHAHIQKTMEARTKQALTLLAGLRDPHSPLSVLNVWIVRKIMRIRSAPYCGVTWDGIKEWRDCDTGALFNRDDKPAVIKSDGTRHWFRQGKLHRDGDQPALIHFDGGRFWYKDGVLHRDGDEPAIIEADGTRYWYKEGKLHRDLNDQPAIIYADGARCWYKDGKLHRVLGDAPAIMYPVDGRQWYRDGQRHRDGDKPAVIDAGGFEEWYLNGIKYK